MANLQVKDVPAALHRRLRAMAERQGRTLRDLVLEAVRREVDRHDFAARLQGRSPVDLGRRAADALDEAREERDEALRR